MARVIRPGGWAAFDILTERCLEGDAMQIWARSGIRNGSYPAVIPRETAVSFFFSKWIFARRQLPSTDAARH